MSEVYYRYEDHPGYLPGSAVVTLCTFTVLKTTPRGVWIRYTWKDKKFVLNSRKRYAYPTMELAMESFKARKVKQMGHLTRQLKQAKFALKMVDLDDFKPVEESWILN